MAKPRIAVYTNWRSSRYHFKIENTGRLDCLCDSYFTVNIMSKRVLLGGIFHETHTFLEETTPLSSFQIRRGEELFSACGDGSPLCGALEVAESCRWDLIPTIDLRATPTGTVDDEVVEHFWSSFGATAQREISNGIDGICLILHGAMVSTSFPDVEGEIVERIRALPGAAETPICGVLDLHGNISQVMAENTQGLIAYRHNPHTDSRDASVRGATLLDQIMTTGQSPVTVWEHPAIMWPPTGTGTADDPMRTLETMARECEHSDPDIFAVNVFGGFSFADTPDTGISFMAVTFGDPDVARKQLKSMSQWAIAHRELGNVKDTPLEDVMPRILEHIDRAETPVAIVEPSDNIGGGAPGDATTVLRTLIEHQIQKAAVVINDPDVVSSLTSVDIGERARLKIGGKSSRLTDGPIELDVELKTKTDGKFELEDRNSHLASMCGVHIDMGPSAVVEHAGIHILLTSRKTPPFDLGQLRSHGIVPESCSVIGVKAAVAHRRAYEKIQKASYTVATPGTCSSDLHSFPFQSVRRPIFPIDELG